WKCPTEISDNKSEDVVVSIKNISDHPTITEKTFTVRIKTVSMSNLKNVKIFLNNNEIKNYNEDKKDFEETISVSNDGVYELKVRSTNEKDKSGESSIKFGVNKAWDYVEPTSAPVATATPAVSPSVTPIL
ncbi:hypothetical protein COS52_02215, partial [Candidatus Roizmanbacteria bacterium CG03_land_8_20_14_0_80_39_12]